jgi:hypothetical protein
MPLSIGQVTAEVVAEADEQSAADAGGGSETPEQRQAIRADLASLARQSMRTRAEGFDD